MAKPHAYVSSERANVAILQCSSFFNNTTKTQGIRECCKENGVIFVYISDIVEDKANCAYHLFEYQGVSVHPGDTGMKLMAERFLAERNKKI